MPFDSKRVYYSEESVHPDRFAVVTRVLSHPVVNDDDIRMDGRKPMDPRPIFMETGVVTRSKGSSYVEVGATKIICACYGPKQLQTRETNVNEGVLVCELRFASFSQATHKTDHLNRTEKELSSIIADALSPSIFLDRFPKAEVDVHVAVLEDGGSVLAAAITAASLALADANIEMYGLVTAASMIIFDDSRLVDPTLQEEAVTESGATKNGTVTVAYINGLSQISMLTQQGYISNQDLTKSVVNLVEVASTIYPLMQQCLYKTAARKLADK